MNSNLIKDIETYNELQNQKRAIEEEMERVKALIVVQLEHEGLKSAITPSGVYAQIAEKSLIKYTDEVRIMDYLTQTNKTNYIVTKINSTALNKDLKTSAQLMKDLFGTYETSISVALTIKEKA